MREVPEDGRRRSDAGSYSLLAIVLGFIFLLLVGMVYDLGGKLRAGQRAGNLAEEAARAGAGQIDRDGAYSGGRLVVDRAAAVRASRAYLAAAGESGSVTPVGATRIRVTVTVTQPTVLLSMIGVGPTRVTRTATADLLTGIEGPGR
ncbi:pilus assembly protein TadG-related protein [Actinomadura chibensis]|uniref:pilus assembly protein TadG-related protein n=1 Tax=Actinomadura chibensis TaxID=392828 RepID=UPI00082B22C7|nr:pilus assembly protein TadG-related protein [Actinomadura chibensis]